VTEHRYDRDLTWRARYRAFFYASRGLGLLLATQWNARIHLLAAVLVLLFGFLLGLAPWEWCAVFFAIAIVWITEALNTALEFLVDLVSPMRQPLAGKVKDVAAGAVLIASLMAVAVGAIIFVPKIVSWWKA